MRSTMLCLAVILALAAPALPGEEGPAPAGRRGPMDQAADGQDQIRKDTDSLAARILELGKKLAKEADGPDFAGFGCSMKAASGQMDRAGGQLRQGVAAAASGSQSRAVNDLIAAKAALRSARETLKQEDPYSQAAERQGELSARADELARRLGELGRHLENARNAQASVGQAGKNMQDAQQSLGGGQGEGGQSDPGRAQNDQRQAMANLGKAMESLRQAAAEAPGKEPKPEEKRDQLAKVAKDQAETRAKTEKLEKLIEDEARRTGEPKLQDAAGHAGNSGRSQQTAEGQLGRGQPGDAQESEEDAKDELERARDKIRDAIVDFQDQQRKEELFKIEKELKELLAIQLRVNGATVEVHKARAGRGLGRPEEAKLFAAALEESEVLARTRATVRRLTDSPVFAWVLDEAAGDVGEVRGRLDRRDTGAYTQEVERDVVRKFEELIDVLKKEQQAEKPAPPPGNPPPGGGPPPTGKPPLVPPLAVLKLIRKMQGDVNDRTRQIDDAVSRTEDKKLTDDFRALLERAAQKQGDVAKVTGSLAEMIEKKTRER